MTATSKIFWARYKSFLAAGLLVSGIIIIYLVFCPEWFFDGEDYGIIFRAAHAAGLKDYVDFFIHGNVCNSCPAFSIDQPENLVPINTYYRPLWQIVDVVRFKLFGLHPYAYFITTVTIHALNATLVMWLIQQITKNLLLSFICSLFFAFHPLLYGWFGKIDMQQHQFTLFLLLMALFVFMQAIQKDHKGLQGVAYFLFLASLLMRETFIVLPFIVLGIFWLFTNQPTMRKLGNLTIGCFIVAGIYIAMRTLSCWPSANIPHNLFPTNIISLSHNIYAHFKHFLLFLYDFFWSQWFPLGTYEFFCTHNFSWIYRLIKIIFIVTIATLFITNTQKKFIFFCFLSVLTLLWPLIIISYGGYRYFYETLPFGALGLATLIHFSTITQKTVIRRCIYVTLCFCIGMSGMQVIRSMQAIMRIPHHITAALLRFKNMQGTNYQNTPLFVCNAPSPLVATGLVQALQLYNISNAKPLYFFAGFIINTNLTAQETQHLIVVNKTNNGLRFISRNRDLITFSALPDERLMYEQQHFYIEQTIIHQHVNNKISDIEFIFKQGYFHPNMKTLALFVPEECLIELSCA